MKKLFFGVCIFVYVLPSLSQNKKLDSLWNIFNSIKQNDSSRAKAIHAIALTYYKINKPDTAIIFFNQELEFAKVTNQKKHEGNALSFLGWFYSNKGDNSKALDYYLKLLKTSEELNNKRVARSAYNSIAYAYTQLADYPKAIEYYLKAIKANQEINDKKAISLNTSGIAAVYLFQSNYQKSLEYFLTALKIAEEIGYKFGIASCFRNIGGIYFQQSNYPKAIEYFLKGSKIHEEIKDNNGLAWSYTNIGAVYEKQYKYSSALEYYLKSLKLLEELNDKKRGLVYGNIGIVYENQLNYPKALENQLEGLKLKKEIKDKKGVAVSYGNLSALFNKVPNYNLALQYSDSSLKLCKIIGYTEGVRIAYQNSATAYSKIGKFKEAYENYQQFKILTDSVFNIENSKQLGDLKTKFEVDKKEAELKVEQEKKELLYQADIRRKQLEFEFEGEQEKLKSKHQLDELIYNENIKRLKLSEDFNKKKATDKAAQDKIDLENKSRSKQQRIIIFSVVLGLLIVITFSIFLYRRFKITQRQKTIIEEQKQVVEVQKIIVEEKHKEITDSINYAERIQRSFLATKELLNENLKDHFVFFQPKDVVSGDFYWAGKLSNGNFLLATADSTGHGVPGAIMSILNISCLEKSVEEEKLIEPGEILNHTRLKIIERLKKDGSTEGGKDGMDCSLICFDFTNSKLVYAAANNPVWIVREHKILELAPDKMPVGKHDRDYVSFTQHNFDLQKGDVVYALTDGMPDQFGGPKGKKFMYKQLKELLISIAPLPMQEQQETLKTVLNNWKGNLEQVDDVCLIGVRV